MAYFNYLKERSTLNIGTTIHSAGAKCIFSNLNPVKINDCGLDSFQYTGNSFYRVKKLTYSGTSSNPVVVIYTDKYTGSDANELNVDTSFSASSIKFKLPPHVIPTGFTVCSAETTTTNVYSMWRIANIAMSNIGTTNHCWTVSINRSGSNTAPVMLYVHMRKTNDGLEESFD